MFTTTGAFSGFRRSIIPRRGIVLRETSAPTVSTNEMGLELWLWRSQDSHLFEAQSHTCELHHPQLS
jgi:hypothetical protein